jgi:dTDP-4-dehydrorhamnose 3,5-epimerase
MRVAPTILQDCFLVHDTVHGDSRGYFFESFNQQRFQEQTGLDIHFVQDNQSRSQKGVLRGLHYQTGEFTQAKLVRVLEGTVLDIAVDLRKNSPSFGQHIAVELSASNHQQLFVPRGFAHGFVVLSEWATFFYKCDNYYNKSAEGGIIYNDKTLHIDWRLDHASLLLSDKDKILPTFKEAIAQINF